MESWFFIVVALCIAALANYIFTYFFPKRRLPPGPPTIPFIGNLIWLRSSVSDLEPILRRFRPRYGSLITFKIGRRYIIFVSSHSLAHKALVQNGAVFSDRPSPPPSVMVLKRPQKEINSSAYGPTWRLLRRNLTQEILHPSRVRAHSSSRRWVLSLLLRRLLVSSRTESSVTLIDHIKHAMYCLFVFMCFGDKLPEKQINEIESVQGRVLSGFRLFSLLDFWPRLGRILFRHCWKELVQLRDEQNRLLIPLIRARIQRISSTNHRIIDQHDQDKVDDCVAYVDTLVDLQLPEDNRKLNEEEMVTLCSEFISAGTDTTSISLQWIMANLVKHPQLQQNLYNEIIATVPAEADTINEEDLQKMPYLKAVVLEALRIHPPGHFVLPHRTTRDVELNGYLIPRDAMVNFTVAEMGRDSEVWEDPMEFRPERFMGAGGEGLDITGKKEIKMMPFGAGRRICPGLELAVLHLEYFVANLVWKLEWKAVEGGVDLTEKQDFTVVMEKPLQANISPRIQ